MFLANYRMISKWEQLQSNWTEIVHQLNIDAEEITLKEILNVLPLHPAIEVPVQESFKLETLYGLLAYEICGKNRDYYELLFGGNESDDHDFFSPGNAPCGYIFKSQDPVYRCFDCGLDDTCVMCARCFKASDHQSHNTSVRYSTGTAGGCCDCGDKEAWKVPGTCKIHCNESIPSSSTAPSFPIPVVLKSIIYETISTILDFIAQTLRDIPNEQKMPEDPSSVHPPPLIYKSTSITEPDFYSCILWNDEHHSFNEVIDQLKDTIYCSANQAKIFAEYVDKIGRSAIYSSHDITLLVSIARKIGRIGLLTTVQSTKILLREELCVLLLEWVASLSSLLTNGGGGLKMFQGVSMLPIEPQIRQILCQELMKHIDHDVFGLSSRVLRPFEVLPETMADYILLSNEKLWKRPRDILKQLFIGSFLIESEESKKWCGRQFARHYLEIVRQTIAEPFPNSKAYEFSSQSLAVQLFTVPTIANMLLLETDILSHNCLLLKAMFMEDNYTFLPDDEPMSIIDNYYEAISYANELRAMKYISYDGAMDNSMLNKNMIIFNDMWHLLAANAFLPESANLFEIKREDHPPSMKLVNYLDLLVFLQGMHLQERAITAHIEYETDSWVGPVSFSMKVIEQVEIISETYFAFCSVKNNGMTLLYLIEKVCDCLIEWCVLDHYLLCNDDEEDIPNGFHKITFFQDGEAIDVPDRRVAFQSVSIHHGLHWLLAGLLSQLPRLSKNKDLLPEIKKKLGTIFQKYDTFRIRADMRIPPHAISPVVDSWASRITVSEKALLMLDYPLQAISFISQVHSNIWIRNGRSIRHQLSHFKENLLRGAYDYDIFLAQFFCIQFGGDMFLTSFIDRFHLVSFFKGRALNGEPLDEAFPKDREISLLEDFLHILIIILSDRSVLAGQTGSEKLQSEMIHCLAAAPNGLPYSVLNDQVSNSINKLEKRKLEETISFDQILNSIATFKYPEGISDSGVYTLKEEYFLHVNPWNISLNRNQRESLEEILKERVRNQQKTENANELRSLNLPNLIPTSSIFSKLGNLIHSKTFVHILLVSLWETVFPLLDKVGTHVVSEMMLGEIVQLILIALHICQKENLLSETDPSANFIYFAVFHKIRVKLPTITEEERDTSLLDIILALIDRANEPEIKDQAQRLRYIIRSFEDVGDSYVRNIIFGWRDKSKWNFFSGQASFGINDSQEIDENDEKAKRKSAAKARQAAIKAQFAQAQNSFKANFGDELEDEDFEDGMKVDSEPICDSDMLSENKCKSRQTAFPSGTCIVCQEDAKSSSKLYGMLCLLQLSNFQRQMDVLDGENMNRVCTAPLNFDEPIVRPPFIPVTTETINNVPPENSSSFFHRGSNLNGSRIAKKGIMPSSCGHLMHISCLDSFLASIQTRQNSQPLRNHPESLIFKEFLCPLCKSLGNAIIPILWPNKTEVPSSHMNQDEFNQHIWLVSVHKLVCEQIPIYLEESLNSANTEDSLIDKNVAACMSPLFSTAESENGWLDTLALVYERFLFKNMRQFQSPADLYFSRPELSLASALQVWDALTYLIVGLEIASRGVSPEPNAVADVRILNTISTINLSLLRVLSETCIPCLLVKVSKNNSSLKKYVHELLESVYPSKNQEGGDQSFAIFRKDGFSNLARICLALFPRFGVTQVESVYPWITLFGYFEIVRTIVSIIEALLLHGNDWIERENIASAIIPQVQEEELKILSKMIFYISSCLGTPSILKAIDSASKIRLIYRLCYSSLLAYSRRTILFLYGRFGVVNPENSAPSQFTERIELERNSDYLLLPSLKNLFAMVENPEFRAITNFWCESLLKKENAYWSSLKADDPSYQAVLVKRQRISIDQGVIYDLISLPNRLEVLFEGALTYICKTCNSVPRDPALCLLCGVFVCCQSLCCGENSLGECNLHMNSCGGSVGIYMSVKKCSMIILCDGNGAFNAPPYLDIHGEVDRGLRRGKPQFLNVKRYAEFRKLWITHGFPSLIARRLEQLLDNGGWRTL